MAALLAWDSATSAILASNLHKAMPTTASHTPPHPVPAPVRYGCTAQLCRQGRAACPCPQACELPAPDADPLHDEPATRTENVLMCAAIAAVAVVLLFTIKACAIA